MDLDSFRRALTAFADRAADIDLARGKLLVQIRDDLIEAALESREGTLWVTENGHTQTAYRWIVDRIARVGQLADRIIEHVIAEPHFVAPAGKLLDQLGSARPNEEVVVSNAVEAVQEVLARRPAGVSTVLYLTSDAGEGKTTVINEIALRQAQQFKAKQSDWLVVPITLGGKPFMRLDDIVVAELTNRLRYMGYYEAFLELIRLNVVVPALDGFEEVFLEGSPGEAVSALGNLINDLDGSGRLLIAARKAYFEINSFAAQAKLYDSISEDAGVDFGRVALERWSEDQFVEYARKRGLDDPTNLIRRVAARLGHGHPLVSRAVLVEKLVNVALEGDVESVLEQLGSEPEDYFFRFVNAIVQREVRKWIGPVGQGDAAQPILSVEEHHELLATIAREMWITNVEALRADYLDIVAEVVGSELDKSPGVVRQIKNRISQHSLLVSVGSGRQIAFDHEDFRRFYLGQALGNELLKRSEVGIQGFLRVGAVPGQTVDAAIARLVREQADTGAIRSILQTIGSGAPPTSYVKENVGALTIRLLELSVDLAESDSLVFPAEALRSRRLESVKFVECHFLPTSLEESQMIGVTFTRCRLDRLEVFPSTHVENVTLMDPTFGSLYDAQREETVFDPARIALLLREYGFTVRMSEEQTELEVSHLEPDRETVLAEHALRSFMRSTHVNELVLRQKLGTRANEFFDDVLPVMIEREIIEEVQYKGAGRQRRFKLLVPMRNIEEAIRTGYTFDSFARALKDT
jgi:hypothetical protein